MEKRQYSELFEMPKPRNPRELEVLTEWYFGKPLHLSLLAVHGPWNESDAGGARYEVAEKYNDYHGGSWLHHKSCIDGYDYSSRFWEYVIGPLTCGGIADRSYGQSHVREAKDVTRLKELEAAIDSNKKGRMRKAFTTILAIAA